MRQSTMASERLPLKLKQSLDRFNEVAMHHLIQLQDHHSNIDKYLTLGDWQKVKTEEIHAMRVIKQMKNLLLEMDTLRENVADCDKERFDEFMCKGKENICFGIKEFTKLQINLPKLSNNSQIIKNAEDSSNVVEFCDIPAHQNILPQLQSNFHQQEHHIAQKQACLNELEQLNHDIRDLSIMFDGMRDVVQDQAVSVQSIADNAIEAVENVQEGERQLQRALTYKKAMYPVVGALLGTFVGGPIGLVAGIKVGGIAAVGCGILGFTGGSVLKGNPSIMHGSIDEPQVTTMELNEKFE